MKPKNSRLFSYGLLDVKDDIDEVCAPLLTILMVLCLLLVIEARRLPKVRVVMRGGRTEGGRGV